MSKGNCICQERRCDWRGKIDDLLSAPNPFDKDDILYACPKCKSIDTAELECEIEGCTMEASCGTPTADLGYIRCCAKHFTMYGVPR